MAAIFPCLSMGRDALNQKPLQSVGIGYAHPLPQKASGAWTGGGDRNIANNMGKGKVDPLLLLFLPDLVGNLLRYPSATEQSFFQAFRVAKQGGVEKDMLGPPSPYK